MIVVDTGGVLALLDADDRHHQRVREVFQSDGERWVLPWAILPEVDYLATKLLGAKVALDFARDLAAGVFRVEGFLGDDLAKSVALQTRYPRLGLGLVDGVVMAQAIRLRAPAIITLDARHFRAVSFGRAPPKLIPLDD